MINVCARCGLYRADKTVSAPTGSTDRFRRAGQAGRASVPPSAVATCPHCGHPHPFLRWPLLLVGGASATGKSAILRELVGRFTAAALLESDLLWQEEFNRREDGHRRFFEMWLRLAKNIGQSGRPVALFGAGLAVPENIEPCVERRYFSRVHYLSLSCGEDVLRQRLQARPAWRNSSHPERLREQLDFNRWLREEGPQQLPPVTLLDTTDTPVAVSARAVSEWMERMIAAETPPADR